MPDVYARITDAPPTVLDRLMAVLEVRAADPQQRAMLETYLGDAAVPAGARALEVGCGTGAVTRVLASWPGVAEAVGVDPSPVFVAKARELGAGHASLSFETAEGQSLPFPDRAFDLVVIHTTLCHVPEPDAIPGWRGASRGWWRPRASGSSASGATAMWRRRPDSC